MKRTIILAAVIVTGLFSINAGAQQKRSSTDNSKSTTQTGTKSTQSDSKVDKKIDQVDTTMSKAKNTTAKGEQTFKDIIGIFGSKTPNEGTVIIPSIEFEDANLESLVKAIKDRKEVKKAVLEYSNGTAVIKLTLKAKAEADFWNELPKELKEVFKMASKKENNIQVTYRPNTPVKIQLAQN